MGLELGTIGGCGAGALPLVWDMGVEGENAAVYARTSGPTSSEEKRCRFDRLYQCICDGLDALFREVGLTVAARFDATGILVGAPITGNERVTYAVR